MREIIARNLTVLTVVVLSLFSLQAFARQGAFSVKYKCRKLSGQTSNYKLAAIVKLDESAPQNYKKGLTETFYAPFSITVTTDKGKPGIHTDDVNLYLGSDAGHIDGVLIPRASGDLQFIAMPGVGYVTSWRDENRTFGWLFRKGFFAVDALSSASGSRVFQGFQCSYIVD